MGIQFFSDNHLTQLKKEYCKYFNQKISDSFFKNIFNRKFFIMSVDGDKIKIAAQCSVKNVYINKQPKTLVLLSHVFIDDAAINLDISQFFSYIRNTFASFAVSVLINVHDVAFKANIFKMKQQRSQALTMLKSYNFSPVLMQTYMPNCSNFQLTSVAHAELQTITPRLLLSIYKEFCRDKLFYSVRSIDDFERLIKYHNDAGNLICSSNDCYGIYSASENCIVEVVSLNDKNMINIILKLLQLVDLEYPQLSNSPKAFRSSYVSNFISQSLITSDVKNIAGYYACNSSSYAKIKKAKISFSEVF